jgi:hypothetical protein
MVARRTALRADRVPGTGYRDLVRGLFAFVEEVACVVAHERGQLLSCPVGAPLRAADAVLGVERLGLGPLELLAPLPRQLGVLERLGVGQRAGAVLNLGLCRLETGLFFAELHTLTGDPLAQFVELLVGGALTRHPVLPRGGSTGFGSG